MSVREKDFAALVLRAAVGPMLIAHGTNKVFGAGGSRGHHRLVRLARAPAGPRPRPHGRGHRDRGGGAHHAGSRQPAPERGRGRLDGHRGRNGPPGQGLLRVQGRMGVHRGGRGGGNCPRRPGQRQMVGRSAPAPESLDPAPAPPWAAAAFGVVAAAALLAASYRPNKKESEPEVEIEIETAPAGGEEGRDTAVTGRPWRVEPLVRGPPGLGSYERGRHFAEVAERLLFVKCDPGTSV